MRSRVAIIRLPGLAAALSLGLMAQQNPPPVPSAGAPRPAFRGPNIAPIAETGFESIFDGQTLKGWEADPNIFRVENGAIVGETTPEKQIKTNSFVIWRGGSPADFELKLEYKLTGNNTGIQIRSAELPEIKWAMKGYQADIDGQQRFTGQIYEERGRGFLAMRGQFTLIQPGGKPGLVASLGDSDELKSVIKSEDWNSLHIIARGNTIAQILNGRLTSLIVDDDPAGRKLEGLIGIQVHAGPPMRIEVRNIRLKKL